MDPIPRNINEFQKRCPKDASILALASDEMGEKESFEFSPYQLSTFDINARERAIEAGGVLRRTLLVPSVTLSSLEIDVNPTDNYCMSVDVEGSEMAVLLGIDWCRLRPKLIWIEDWDFTRNSGVTPVSQFLCNLGYQNFSHVGLSSFYLHC